MFRPAPFELFDSFEEAGSRASGYDDEELAELVVTKTESYAAELSASRPLGPQSIANLLVVALAGRDRPEPLEVMDFGGAAGALFYETDSVMPGVVGSWTVVETPAMVARASGSVRDGRLSFAGSILSVPSQRLPDLVIASGSLHYTPKPVSVMKQLLASEPSWIYVTRTLMSDGTSTLFALQTSRLGEHGPGGAPGPARKVTTAVAIPPRSSFEEALTPGYEAVLRFEDKHPFALGAYTVVEGSFLARRSPS